MFHQLRESLAFERSIGHPARKIVTIAEQPGFSNWLISGQLCPKPFLEEPAAPKSVLKDRFKP
jgi:hypothetical protein